MTLMNKAFTVFLLIMAVLFVTQIFGCSPEPVEYCDGDFCGASRAELQHYHDQTPWTSYDAAKVTVVAKK